MNRMISRLRTRLLPFFLCLAVLVGMPAVPSQAAQTWPSNVSISADGGIVIDADSGTVLYGKNIHTTYFPASITKILTALIVLENCAPNEVVTFSHRAVYDVEEGSSNAGLDEGDRLTVRDTLYAMMLKSANEAANALAEHTAGSIEAFAKMMNEKAAELGCTDSHFNNPSGLNDPEHYTSAHDMALIAQAAFANDDFVEIDSTLYYDLPPTKRNPDGLRVYPGHRMLRKNTSQYYPGILGGKTGYTSLAGNTLVTCAERDGMRLIAVVLNGHQTHYADTRTLLNFGFEHFKSVEAAALDSSRISVENDMTIAGLPTTDLSVLQLEKGSRVTLPTNADPRDITSAITYELPSSAPEDAVAQIAYDYGGRRVGSSYLLVNKGGAEATQPAIEVTAASEELSSAAAEDGPGRSADGGALPPDDTNTPEAGGAGARSADGNAPAAYSADGNTPASFSADTDAQAASDGEPARSTDEPAAKQGFRLPLIVRILLTLLLIAGAGAGFYLLRLYMREREAADRFARQERRKQRLQELGVSDDEFDRLLQQKRSSSAAKRRQAAQSDARRRRHKNTGRRE